MDKEFINDYKKTLTNYPKVVTQKDVLFPLQSILKSLKEYEHRQFWDLIDRRGVFVYQEGEEWVAVDNMKGERFLESFKTRSEAIKWLVGRRKI